MSNTEKKQLKDKEKVTMKAKTPLMELEDIFQRKTENAFSD